MTRWFYKHYERTIGPIDPSTMREWVRERSIHPDHVLRKEGETEWRTAESYPELWIAEERLDDPASRLPDEGAPAAPLQPKPGEDDHRARRMTVRVLMTSAIGLGLGIAAGDAAEAMGRGGPWMYDWPPAEFAGLLMSVAFKPIEVLMMVLVVCGVLPESALPIACRIGDGMAGLLLGLLAARLWIWVAPPRKRLAGRE